MEDPRLSQPLLSSIASSVTTPATTAITISSSSSPAEAVVATTCNLDEKHHRDQFKHSASSSGVILRLISFVSIGIISLWANYEASKGFGIAIINDAGDSPAGKRFALFYVSDDRATRMVVKTSSFVENVLYANNNHAKKPVRHVTLRLAGNNITAGIPVVETDHTGVDNDHFIINMSPSVMAGVDSSRRKLDNAIESVVLRGMARVWLWNGGSPAWLLDGMVEYIAALAGFGGERHQVTEFGRFCGGDKDPKAVAQFFCYCEGKSKGFIQRLNQCLKNGWNDRTVEDALGTPVNNVCDSYKKLAHGFPVGEKALKF